MSYHRPCAISVTLSVPLLSLTSLAPPQLVVLCLNELKMGMMAKSCLCPGTNALVFNLISSFNAENSDDSARPWLSEYKVSDERGAISSSSSAVIVSHRHLFT